MEEPRVITIGDVNDSMVMYINKGNAFFARESKGNAHGTQGERSNQTNSQHYLLLLIVTDEYRLPEKKTADAVFWRKLQDVWIIIITKRKCLKRPLNWGKMIPINNDSKYRRTVTVYVDDELLIIVLASACKWPIKAILMLPRALGFSVWCKPAFNYTIIDPLHKWCLNLNNNTWHTPSLTFMFQDKEIFTWIWG